MNYDVISKVWGITVTSRFSIAWETLNLHIVKRSMVHAIHDQPVTQTFKLQ